MPLDLLTPKHIFLSQRFSQSLSANKSSSTCLLHVRLFVFHLPASVLSGPFINVHYTATEGDLALNVSQLLDFKVSRP